MVEDLSLESYKELMNKNEYRKKIRLMDYLKYLDKEIQGCLKHTKFMPYYYYVFYDMYKDEAKAVVAEYKKDFAKEYSTLRDKGFILHACKDNLERLDDSYVIRLKRANFFETLWWKIKCFFKDSFTT